MYSRPRFLPAGDNAVCMELSDGIEEECNTAIRGIVDDIFSKGIRGIVETVPTYRSILVYYDPFVMYYDDAVNVLKRVYDKLDISSAKNGDTLVIPVLYGGESGPDLPFVAEHAHLTEKEVIDIHTSVDYLIYMLGFTPGFTYLGGMDERIATPRLKTPRKRIPAGSVGIAGKQTGMYPIDSPGGWRLIGITPVKLYDPYRDVPILPKMGDRIRFKPISEKEFNKIKKEVDDCTYQVDVIKGETS